MAFSASGASGSFHMLVEFALDSTTLRYADEDLTIMSGNTTGNFYEGRLPSFGTLVRDLGNFMEAKENVSTFDVQLDNHDRAIADLTQQHTFANRQVRVWLGEGRSKAHYSEISRGNVAFPNGVRWDEDAAYITVIDQQVRNRRTLPPSTQLFDTTTYPNVEAKSKNVPIPIIYGNWSSAVGNALSVPAACVNTATLQFKVAHHKLLSIDRYIRNAARIPANNIKNVSLSAATFQLSAYSYNATEDVVAVNCQGLMTINNTLIERPADILRHMLTAYCGLTSGDIDVTGINTMNTNTGSEVYRRWIGSREGESTETLIQELMGEAQADLRFVSGKYSPKYRSLDLVSGRTTIDRSDIVIEERSEKAEYTVEMDPQRYYANRITARYRPDPINVRYDTTYVTSSPVAINNASAIVERPFDMNWSYTDTTTQARIARELVIFSSEPINVQALLTNRAMLLSLADQLDFTYDVFNNYTLQVRRLETNLAEMTTRVSGFNIFMRGIGRWTADDAPSWSLASQAQRDAQGFWCNASGYASSVSDPLALLASRWY